MRDDGDHNSNWILGVPQLHSGQGCLEQHSLYIKGVAVV